MNKVESDVNLRPLNAHIGANIYMNTVVAARM